MSLLSVFGRWYWRKFSDPDAAMLLILIIGIMMNFMTLPPQTVVKVKCEESSFYIIFYTF